MMVWYLTTKEKDRASFLIGLFMVRSWVSVTARSIFLNCIIVTFLIFFGTYSDIELEFCFQHSFDDYSFTAAV